jgi:hypothetical protein
MIDPADNVAEARMLQAKPFEIIYKVAGRSKPNPIPSEFLPHQSVFVTHADTVTLIANTRRYLDNTLPANSDTMVTLSNAVHAAENPGANTSTDAIIMDSNHTKPSSREVTFSLGKEQPLFSFD